MNTEFLDEHTAAHIAELFRSFSDTSRVRIIFAILDQELNTSGLSESGRTSPGCLSVFRAVIMKCKLNSGKGRPRKVRRRMTAESMRR